MPQNPDFRTLLADNKALEDRLYGGTSHGPTGTLMFVGIPTSAGIVVRNPDTGMLYTLPNTPGAAPVAVPVAQSNPDYRALLAQAAAVEKNAYGKNGPENVIIYGSRSAAGISVYNPRTKAIVFIGSGSPPIVVPPIDGAAFKLGFYSSNPSVNSQNENNQFLVNYDDDVLVTGKRPASMNTFVDFTQSQGNQPANVYYNFEAMKNTGPNYVGIGSGVVPFLGIGVQCPGYGHDEIFDDILAGNWDQTYYDIGFNAFNSGYPLIYIRIMYEFNGGFMSWCPANSGRPDRFTIFVAVYKRIADRLRAALAAVKASGKTVDMKLVWNPTSINYNSGDIIIENLYPGDDYTDDIGPDSYGKAYPRDGSVSVTDETSYKRYLSYNDTTYAHPQGDGSGCSVERMAQFALDHNKPFSMSELGCGNNDANVGPLDNHWYYEWLGDFVSRWLAKGLKFSYLNAWVTDQSDGGWGVLRGQRPLAAAALRANFGKPVVDDGLPKTLKFYGNTDNSNYAYLPDSPSLRVTTQTVRITARKSRVDVASDAALGGKWNNTTDPQYADYKEYFFARNPDGKLIAVWRTASAIAVATSSVADGVPLGTVVDRRVLFTPSTGLTKFYISTDNGTTFTQLGSDVTATDPGAIAATAHPQDMLIGQHSGGGRNLTGFQGGLEVVIDGVTVLDANTTLAGMKDSVSNAFFGRGYCSLVNANTGLAYRPA